jgi:hypothetical protein
MRERVRYTPTPALVEWLRFDAHDVEGWDSPPSIHDVRCHPDLIDVLLHLARAVGKTGNVYVDGVPVIHHPGGAPIAFAAGQNVLGIRSALPAGPLVSDVYVEELGDDWVMLDWRALDVTFSRTKELLASHMQAAYDRVESGAWR